MQIKFLTGNESLPKRGRVGIQAVLLLTAFLVSPFAFAGSPSVSITFSNLTATDGTAMTGTYTEGAFTVTPTTSGWIADQSFGNGTPAIAGIVGTATVEITDGGTASFVFNSIDLAGNGASYDIVGKLGSSTVFSLLGVGTLSSAFTTINNPGPSAVINSLFVTMDGAGTSPSLLTKYYDVDNIVVTQVPEPSTLAFTGLAAAGLFLFRRRR